MQVRESRRLPNGTLGPVPIEQRLWQRVEVVGKCWEFQGTRSEDGYGSIRFKGRMQKAHRVAWQLAKGDIPDDLMVCHRCDNPPCINPEQDGRRRCAACYREWARKYREANRDEINARKRERRMAQKEDSAR